MFPCSPGRPFHQEGSEHSSLPSSHSPRFPPPQAPSLQALTEYPLRPETSCLYAVEEEMLGVTFHIMEAGLSDHRQHIIQIIPLRVKRPGPKHFFNSKFLVAAFYLFIFVWLPTVCPPCQLPSLLLAFPIIPTPEHLYWLFPLLGKRSKNQISLKRED